MVTEPGLVTGEMIWWLTHYAFATPGCESGNNSTWVMLGSAPQPDAHLRVLPSHGGQSGTEKGLGAGASELVVEICLTSTEIDFGPKPRLYQRAGVREYAGLASEAAASRVLSWRVACPH